MFAKKLNNHHYVFNLRTRRSGYKALTEGLRNVQLVALSAKTPIPQEGDSVFYCGHIDWFTVESVTHFETFSELMESDLFYYLIPNALSENAIKLLEEKADNPRITAGIFALELRYDPEAYDLDEEDFGFSELTIINYRDALEGDPFIIVEDFQTIFELLHRYNYDFDEIDILYNHLVEYLYLHNKGEYEIFTAYKGGLLIGVIVYSVLSNGVVEFAVAEKIASPTANGDFEYLMLPAAYRQRVAETLLWQVYDNDEELTIFVNPDLASIVSAFTDFHGVHVVKTFDD